jgi:hypothetical protein
LGISPLWKSSGNFFFVVVGFELSTLPWVTLSAYFCHGFFQDRVSWLFAWAAHIAILLIAAPWVTRIVGESHQCLASGNS